MTRTRDMTLGELQAHAKQRNDQLLARRQALTLHFQQLQDAIALKSAARRTGVILNGLKRRDHGFSARRLARHNANQNGKASLGTLDAFNKQLASEYDEARKEFDVHAEHCRKNGWALMFDAPRKMRLHPTKGWRSGNAA